MEIWNHSNNNNITHLLTVHTGTHTHSRTTSTQLWQAHTYKRQPICFSHWVTSLTHCSAPVLEGVLFGREEEGLERPWGGYQPRASGGGGAARPRPRTMAVPIAGRQLAKLADARRQPPHRVGARHGVHQLRLLRRRSAGWRRRQRRQWRQHWGRQRSDTEQCQHPLGVLQDELLQHVDGEVSLQENNVFIFVELVRNANACRFLTRSDHGS